MFKGELRFSRCHKYLAFIFKMHLKREEIAHRLLKKTRGFIIRVDKWMQLLYRQRSKRCQQCFGATNVAATLADRQSILTYYILYTASLQPPSKRVKSICCSALLTFHEKQLGATVRVTVRTRSLLQQPALNEGQIRARVQPLRVKTHLWNKMMSVNQYQQSNLNSPQKKWHVICNAAHNGS